MKRAYRQANSRSLRESDTMSAMRRLKRCDLESDSDSDGADDPDYNPPSVLSCSRIEKYKSKMNNTRLLKRKVSGSKASKRPNNKWATPEELYSGTLPRYFVLLEAEKTLATIEKNVRCVVKRMLPSNVVSGAWMHLPREFCRKHMPNKTSIIWLVDESGNKYWTRYIPKYCGLAGGWGTFSASHKLNSGEILIFQLIGPHKIKVHIVRVPDEEDIDAALSVMHMSLHCVGSKDDLRKDVAKKVEVNLKEKEQRLLKYSCKVE